MATDRGHAVAVLAYILFAMCEAGKTNSHTLSPKSEKRAEKSSAIPQLMLVYIK